MNKIIVICTLLSVLCSCGASRKSSKESGEIVKFDSKSKEKARELDMELLPCTKDFLSATNFYVYKDSLLVVSNCATDVVPLFEFYNLKTKKKINQFLYKSSPEDDDVLATKFSVKGKNLILNNYNNKSYCVVDLDSVLHNSNYKLEKQIVYGSESVSSISVFEDGRALMLNPYYFDNDEFGDNIKEPCLVVFDSAKQDTLSFEKHLYNTCNVTQGDIFINEKNDRVVFCSLSTDQVEIYDTKLNPIKKITGFSDINLKYVVSQGYIFVESGFPLFFNEGCYDDEFIYVPYFGEEMEQIGKVSSWLFKMDWDGNVVKTFKLPKIVFSLSKSEENGVFYCSSIGDNGVPELYKININK